jgi:hypothetical protein
VGCSTEHLGPAVQRRSQVALAGVAFTRFQKAAKSARARASSGRSASACR